MMYVTIALATHLKEVLSLLATFLLPPLTIFEDDHLRVSVAAFELMHVCDPGKVI